MKKVRSEAKGCELTVRVVVKDAPAGVKFAVQRDRSELLEPLLHTDTALMFDVPIRVVAKPGSEAPNILGPYAQGPASDRFLYLNSGTLAGQTNTPWTRRAKIKTAGISWALVEAALAHGNGCLLAEVHGLAADGGPCCGTVPLLGGAWRVFDVTR